MDSQPPSSDRREYHRYEIWFPVILMAGAQEVWATCRDASSNGLLVSSKTALELGAAVTVRFRITREGMEHRYPGRVVRHENNRNELRLTFPYAVAIEFDEAQSALEHRIRNASEAPGAPVSAESVD